MEHPDEVLNMRRAKSPALEEEVSTTEAVITAWTHALGNSERVAAENMTAIFDRRGIPRPSIMHGHVEDELRHSAIIQGSVARSRERLLSDPAYRKLERACMNRLERWLVGIFSQVMSATSDPDLIYCLGAIPIEKRVLDHYTRLAEVTPNAAVRDALRSVLREEMQHSGMMHWALGRHPLAGEAPLEAMLAGEASLWADMTDRVRSLVGEAVAEASA